MSQGGLARRAEILLVEDNDADVRLTREALKEGRISNRLHVASDGEQALDFLYRRGPHADAPRPDLILLDLNLPRLDGREVLATIKQDTRLKQIPVVVLTTSRNTQDLVSAYNLHANCFIGKPVDFDEFIGVVRSIEQFWFSIVVLPPANGAA